MTYPWVKFFETLSLLSIAGTFIIIGLEIKDFPKRYRRRPAAGGRKKASLGSLRRSSLRWSALCILWTVISISHLVNPNEGERLFYGLLSLFFLAMALFFMQMPRFSRYIRRRRFAPDPQSMLHLSK